MADMRVIIAAWLSVLSLAVCRSELLYKEYSLIPQMLPLRDEVFTGTIASSDLPSVDTNPSTHPSEYYNCSAGLHTSNYEHRLLDPSGYELYFQSREDLQGEPSLLALLLFQERILRNSSIHGAQSFFDFLKIDSLDRSVTLYKGNVAKVSITMQITAAQTISVGDEFPSDGIKWFHFLLPFQESHQMTDFKAVAMDTKANLLTDLFSTSNLTADPLNRKISPRRYVIFLDEPMRLSTSKTLQITYTLGRVMAPFADRIPLKDQQVLKYVTNSLVLSPYPIIEQKSAFIFMKPLQVITTNGFLPKGLEILSNGKRFVTEVFHDPPRFTMGETLEFRIRGNIPLLYLSEMNKTVTFLPWNSVKTKISYKITNEASRLKEQFSRIQHLYLPKVSNSVNELASRVLTSLEAYLPNNVQSLQYYDGLGFITTASITNHSYSLYNLELIPRYPLYGGWTTQFVLDFVQNTSEYVENDAQNSKLQHVKIPLDHYLDNVYAERVLLSVILPSGASVKEVDVPFDVTYTEHQEYNWFEIFSPSKRLLFKINGLYQSLETSQSNIIAITYKSSDYSRFWLGFWMMLALSVPAVCVFFLRKLSFEVADSSDFTKREKSAKKSEILEQIFSNLELLSRKYAALEIACQGDTETVVDKRVEFKAGATELLGKISGIIEANLPLSSSLTELNPILKDYVIELTTLAGACSDRKGDSKRKNSQNLLDRKISSILSEFSC